MITMVIGPSDKSKEPQIFQLIETNVVYPLEKKNRKLRMPKCDARKNVQITMVFRRNKQKRCTICHRIKSSTSFSQAKQTWVPKLEIPIPRHPQDMRQENENQERERVSEMREKERPFQFGTDRASRSWTVEWCSRWRGSRHLLHCSPSLSLSHPLCATKLLGFRALPTTSAAAHSRVVRTKARKQEKNETWRGERSRFGKERHHKQAASL